jgi:integrase
MSADNGIDNGKINGRKKNFDLFRPVSVKPDGRRIESPNWCVRFQHRGKRTCRSLGTADYRLAGQRAREMVKAVRSGGWGSATVLPTSHGSISISDFLERYHRSAVSRGLRSRSIAGIEKELRRLTKEMGARRLADLTPLSLQQWVENSSLKPISLNALLSNAACPFSKPSLKAMGMNDLQNPFANLVKPKVDREAFTAPPRSWITGLMADGIKELDGDVRRAFVLALGGGLRWGEITSLSWENVLPNGLRVLASLAKGRRSRVVPMGKTVQCVLEESRKQRAVISGDAKEVHEGLSGWLRKHGVKDAKPIHYLRKCFGSLAVADHGIFLASKLLGHSTITLTASTYAGQVDKLPAVKF